MSKIGNRTSPTVNAVIFWLTHCIHYCLKLKTVIFYFWTTNRKTPFSASCNGSCNVWIFQFFSLFLSTISTIYFALLLFAAHKNSLLSRWYFPTFSFLLCWWSNLIQSSTAVKQKKRSTSESEWVSRLKSSSICDCAFMIHVYKLF